MSEMISAPLDNAIQINYTIEPGVRHDIISVVIEAINTHNRRDSPAHESAEKGNS